MHTILWEDAKWQKCEMHLLVTPSDVKKAYRKACLAVHPDKVKIKFLCNLSNCQLINSPNHLQQAGTENESIAKLIFIELNNAWSDFENDATQQNMFSS